MPAFFIWRPKLLGCLMEFVVVWHDWLDMTLNNADISKRGAYLKVGTQSDLNLTINQKYKNTRVR